MPVIAAIHPFPGRLDVAKLFDPPLHRGIVEIEEQFGHRLVAYIRNVGKFALRELLTAGECFPDFTLQLFFALLHDLLQLLDLLLGQLCHRQSFGLSRYCKR